MTKAKKALRALVDGSPMTGEEVMQGAGLAYTNKGNVLQYLKSRGYIESAPVRYQITEEGRKHALKVPKTPYLEKKLATRHKRQEEQARLARGIPNSVWAFGDSHA